MKHPLYPELDSAGGLTFALDIAFAAIGSALNMSNIQDSFTKDTPTVTPIVDNQQYLVRASDGMELGAGSASEALKMVLEHLPKDIGPAVKGTSEDL